MPQAVFHIIFAILIAEIIREFFIKNKRKFPVYYVFIAGLAGIIPDLDIAAFWILNFFGFAINEVHRTFTHTLFLPLIFLILAGISWKAKRRIGKQNLKLSIIFLMIALGIFFHLFLDFIISGQLRPFFPVSDYAIGLNIIQYLPFALQQIVLPSIDAGIFILWLIWLECRHKISDFI